MEKELNNSKKISEKKKKTYPLDIFKSKIIAAKPKIK